MSRRKAAFSLILAVFTLFLLPPALLADPKPSEKPKDQPKKDPTFNHLFDIRNIEGWTVYVNKKDLTDHPEKMQTALDHFQQQLYQIRLNTPAPAVAIMQQNVPLWFEYDTLGIAYHGRGWLVANGYKPPDVPTNAGFCRAKDFERIALHQPWVVFHELAHGYDFRYMRQGRKGAHPLIQSAYDTALKAGKYNPVLCRYSEAAKAYGANNTGEFFTENSEAFLGANDFYPFVRAELKEYDPQTYNAMCVLWGVDPDHINRQQRSLAKLMDKYPPPVGWSPSQKSNPTKNPIDTSKYKHRQVQGWPVLIDPELLKEKALADETLKLLGYKLHMVKRYVPEQAIAKLQKTTITLQRNNPAVPYITYSQKQNCILIPNPESFRRWQHIQPSALLHHLALAYFDSTLGGENQQLNKAFEKAVKNGKYDRVLRFDGKRVKHPALLNVKQFFAEMTESYYGFNDHYPFIQFELAQHDPAVCELLAQLWGAKAK